MTERRTKKDFALEIDRLAALPRYRRAAKIHFVLDNLNTHFEASAIATFGKKRAHTLLRRIVFHHTPLHASWLNMAEIELSILSRQALRGRIGTAALLSERIGRWQEGRNTRSATIQWKFTRDDARRVFKYDIGAQN